MIRRAFLASAAVLSLVLLVPGDARSQSIYVLGGVSIPFSDYDSFNTGWLGAAGVTFPVGTAGLWAGAEGLYGGNPAEFDILDDANVWSVMGLLGYDIATSSSVSPYLWGGLGIMGLSAGESDSGFGWQFGAGVALDRSPSFTPFFEARYQSASINDASVGFAAFALGVSFDI